MLRIDTQETLNGLTVFADDAASHIFYVIPEAPRFRVDDKGQPVFKFIKYREPVDRPGDSKGGGFVFFDTEFSLTPDQDKAIREALQPRVNAAYAGGNTPPPKVQLGVMTYTKGTSNLLIKDGAGGMVQAVRGAGKPSLFGRNISCFMLELSDRGATVFEQALQGKGGVVQVVYDLDMWAKLPPLEGRAWFNSTKFYSFYQTIDIEWNGMYVEDDYTESVTEQFFQSETMDVEINFPAAFEGSEDLKSEIRQNLRSNLADAVTRLMIPDIDKVPLEDRKAPEDIENVKRSITESHVSSFEERYRENSAIAWNIAPQGTLPNITTMTDYAGKPVVWGEYASLVDLNDPFFKQLRVNVSVNADFGALPIDSVEVKVNYDEGDKHEVAEYLFRSPDETKLFQTYIENDNATYRYSYQVNYKGESKVYTSPEITQDGDILRPSVGDLGILDIKVIPGDIDFTQVNTAQVSVAYEASGIQPVALDFVLRQGETPAPVQKVIFQPQDAPIRYKVRYFMKDGREILADWVSQRSTEIHVNDPLGQYRTVPIRAVGDLATKIDTIYLDLAYDDPANNYRTTHSQALNAATPYFDWRVPTVGDGKGTVTYSGQIRYRDGSTRPIEKATADGSILVGDQAAGKLTIQVEPVVVDFAVVKVAKVSLRYADPANGIETTQDIVFKAGDQAASWSVDLADPAQKRFSWRVTYYRADGTETSTEWAETEGTSVVLPAAGPAAPAPTPVAPPVTPVAPVVPAPPTPPAPPAGGPVVPAPAPAPDAGMPVAGPN